MENNTHIPDGLKKAGKKLPFTVPEGYFSTFPDRLQERLKQQEKQPALIEQAGGEPAWQERFLRVVRPHLGMAAMIAGILLVSLVGLRYLINGGSNSQLDPYELTEIADYYLTDYDDDLIYSAILESGTEMDIQPLEEYSDEILDYLNAEDIDYSLLINDQ